MIENIQLDIAFESLSKPSCSMKSSFTDLLVPCVDNFLHAQYIQFKMRKECTRTSPDNLFPTAPYANPLSPKSNQPSFTTFKSPSQRVEQDHLEKKYPTSYKYSPTPNEHQYRQQVRSPQIYRSPQPDRSIEISELRLTINQLRNSLQVCSENSQRMQEELFLERSKNVEQAEVRRRMEDQIKRMEFQLDRIGNYQSLQTRENSIKLENALRENNKLSMQVSDLIEQLKGLKQENRKLMTEYDTLLKEKQTLMRENQSLSEKLKLLENEVHQVKQEVAIQSQRSLHFQSQNNLPSRVNNIQTVRTYQASTINNSPRMIPTRHSIDLQELPEQVDYEEENKRLLDDYKKLLEENQSMKQLYNNFYKNQGKEQPQGKINLQELANNQIGRSSFSNKIINENLNFSRSEEPEQNEAMMLQTIQKEKLKTQVSLVRDSAITELIKVYNKSLEKSKLEKKNCLKVYIHQLIKNKNIYVKMAENYLEVRLTIQEDAGLKLDQKLDRIVAKDDKQRLILDIYQSVKQKAKNEKDIGLCLAIFRLITLIVKSQWISPSILDSIKHSTLKYLYKLNNHTQH